MDFAEIQEEFIRSAPEGALFPPKEYRRGIHYAGYGNSVYRPGHYSFFLKGKRAKLRFDQFLIGTGGKLPTNAFRSEVKDGWVTFAYVEIKEYPIKARAITKDVVHEIMHYAPSGAYHRMEGVQALHSGSTNAYVRQAVIKKGIIIVKDDAFEVERDVITVSVEYIESNGHHNGTSYYVSPINVVLEMLKKNGYTEGKRESTDSWSKDSDYTWQSD